MGICHSSPDRDEEQPRSAAPIHIARGLLPSLYQQRLTKLAREAIQSPPPEPLEATLRACIAVAHGGGPDWAPKVRTTVFADNSAEHQFNVPVYATLLCAWGVPGFEQDVVKCKPIPGTDVHRGHATPSAFWSRRFALDDGPGVAYRDIMHQLLHWFVSLPDDDARKQWLVNMILQLHEACYNCIGRHKEVFEYCVHDLIDAETLPQEQRGESDADVLAAKRVVYRHAARCLDKHKRNALHAAMLSPLKFIFQKQYSVFENLDSHGASFWVSMMTDAFFHGLDMPFESIVRCDTGWRWGAVEFLPLMQSTADGQVALERLSSVDNLGFDWRAVTAGLRPPVCPGGDDGFGVGFRGLPYGFKAALQEARRPGSPLHRNLRPYAARFAGFMELHTVCRCVLLSMLGSVAWDASLGPALAALSVVALGEPLTPDGVRSRLFPDPADPDTLEVSIKEFVAFLKAAGVDWWSLQKS